MEVLDKIIDLLNKNDIRYERIDHEPVYTSEEAAKIRDTTLSMGAKALVCFGDKKPLLIVLPGDTKLDSKCFKKLFKIKDLRMASREEVEALTGLEVGSIPPLGNLMGLETYFDEKIKTKDIVAFNAGSHTTSIRMKAEDLITLVEPKLSSFAVAQV